MLERRPDRHFAASVSHYGCRQSVTMHYFTFSHCRRIFGCWLIGFFGLGWHAPAGAVTEQQAATEQQSVRLATEHWPGYSNPDGSGAYFELIRLVLPPAQFAMQWQLMPFGRAIVAVEKGQADIVFAVAPQDSALLLLSAAAMDSDRIVAVYRRDSGLQLPLSEAQLAGLRLSWRLAYNYGQVLGVSSHGYEVPDVMQGLKLVQSGRVDVFLAEQAELDEPIYQTLLQQGLGSGLVRQTAIFAGFAPTPQGRQLKQHWDTRWRQLQGSEELQAFYQRYPGMRVPVGLCSGTLC